MATGISSDDLAFATALVREHDRPRYYATLFAPAEARADLFALYGFAAEIARIPDIVSDPTLGEIRLTWWQEALAQATAPGSAASTPTLRALADTIARHRLPLAAFEALIEARAADLYSDPPATIADLEGRMGETESALFQMAAIILGARGPETAEASGHAGIAYGVARRLAAFASDRARGRTIIPAESLAAEGLSAADMFAATFPANVNSAIAAMTRLGRDHLGRAQDRIGALPRPLRSAFLPLAVAAPLFGRMEGQGRDLASRDVRVPDLETLLRVALAALRARAR